MPRRQLRAQRERAHRLGYLYHKQLGRSSRDHVEIWALKPLNDAAFDHKHKGGARRGGSPSPRPPEGALPRVENGESYAQAREHVGSPLRGASAPSLTARAHPPRRAQFLRRIDTKDGVAAEIVRAREEVLPLVVSARRGAPFKPGPNGAALSVCLDELMDARAAPRACARVAAHLGFDAPAGLVANLTRLSSTPARARATRPTRAASGRAKRAVSRRRRGRRRAALYGRKQVGCGPAGERAETRGELRGEGTAWWISGTSEGAGRR